MVNSIDAKLKELAQSFAKAHEAINGKTGEQEKQKEPNEPNEPREVGGCG